MSQSLARSLTSTRLLRLGVTLGSMFWVTASIPAATWVLLNGDHISGELISETSTTIQVQHPTLGRIEIPRSALAPAPEAKAGSARPTAAAGVQWKRQLEFGYSRQSDITTQQNVSVRGQIDGTSGPDTYRGTAQLLESESAGVTQADRVDADFRWRHEVSKQVFVQSLTTGCTDALRGIDFSLEEQLGAGWKILAAKEQTANLGFGVAVRQQDQQLVGDSTGLLGTVFQDYARTWTGGLRFSQESSLALAAEQPLSAAPSPLGSTPVPAGGGNYRLRFNAALQGKMPGHATFTVRYDYNYDRSVLESDLRSDQRVTTSLGYAW